ncbi:MAG TPA: glycosyltransferase family A protein [Solirubrobacterales bacterium]|nr:glycosyltransferase family A protein [Solirubrobacterales bacterium]
MPEPSSLDIAVVIPTYNRRDLLEQTLGTVFAQTAPPAEVIVVDDGSDDGTAELLAGMPVTVVANPAGGWGPSRARNEGLGRVKSRLVAFLDSDDLLLPAALEVLGSALAADRAAPFAFGTCLLARRDPAGWVIEGEMGPEPADLREPLASLYARNFVPSVGTVVRTAAAFAVGGFPQVTTFAEDHYFWLLLARDADPVFVPELTAVHRTHSGNRHTPARAEDELEAFLALAVEDKRLEAAIPDRLGVGLAESLGPAVKGGDFRGTVRALRTNLLSRREKAAILRRAGHHVRSRRHRDALTVAHRSEDEQLTAWLADH